MKKFVALILTLCFVLSSAIICQATDTKTEDMPVISDGAQISVTFPLEVDELDDTLAMNNMLMVYSFQGQGKITVIPEDVESFDLYINGERFETKNEKFEADYSKISINGANLVQVTNIKPQGGKVTIKAKYPVLREGKPADVGVNDDTLKFIDKLLEKEVEHGFPGGQLVIVKDGVLIKSSAYGNVNSYLPDGTRIENPIKTTEDTLYDLASNTKMYATNFALQKLVSEGKIRIDDKISKYFPSFKDEKNDEIKGKDEMTIQHVLEHQAGFPADPQYHNENYDKDDGNENGKNDLYSIERKKTKEMILKTPLQYEPGTETIYSDVDYMLLGLIVEEVTGMPLDKYVEENIYHVLGLKHVLFNPLAKGFSPDDCAATELNGNSRDGKIEFKANRSDTIQGEVHDEKAFYAMDGVSGHAGLFASAKELAVLAQVMLNGGGYDGYKFFDRNTIEQFIKPKFSNVTYGLGWRRMGDRGYPWYFGPLAGSATYGHTGWTGTLSLIDPTNNLIIIWLSNKINSPVVDPEKNPNYFYGNHFLGGTLGVIPSIAYQALFAEDTSALHSLLLQMLRDKINLINEVEAYDNIGDYDALAALVDFANEISKEMQDADYQKEINDALQALKDENLKNSLMK